MSRKQLLVGIHGLAYTGKSTAANTLAKKLELKKYAIAESVTQACAAALEMPHHDFLTLPKEDTVTGFVFTKRQLMQCMGHSLRNTDNNFLLHTLELRMHLHRKNHMYDYLLNGSLITDIRLPTEAQWLRNQGGTLIHIIRHNAPATTQDVTEQTLAIEPQDIVITNNSTIEELETKIHHLASDLRENAQAAA